MRVRIERVHDRHAGEAVRTVLVVLAPLVQHDLALVGELRVGQRGQQIAHAIRFHPQRTIERVGRHHLPVVGAVGVRGSVQRRAGFLQRMKVAAVVMLRSLEHEVLEQVREPRPAGHFVLRSDVVPDVHRDDRQRVILVDQHVESVGKRVLGERDVHYVRSGAFTRASYYGFRCKPRIARAPSRGPGARKTKA